MYVAVQWPKLQKKVQVSLLSIDMTERKNKIKIMSSELFQVKKEVYCSARNNASADNYYITTKY